jgi:hypothetical protein
MKCIRGEKKVGVPSPKGDPQPASLGGKKAFLTKNSKGLIIKLIYVCIERKTDVTAGILIPPPDFFLLYTSPYVKLHPPYLACIINFYY